MAKIQKITPFIWFNNQAEEAANFYVSLFKKSQINRTVGNDGQVMVVDFSLAGQQFNALNGGPMHQINQSISFFISCNSLAETKKTWKQLAKGGQVMMPLAEYPWSKQYGWVQDKFGVSWQVMLGKFASTKQKIMPCFLFTGAHRLQAETAVNFYQTVFEKSTIATISRYEKGGAGPEGSLQYAEFSLAGQTFSAMDNPQTEANFTFNEALSFVVNCKNQKEVDNFWEKLTADGGSEGQCGWLKDKFGLSWQIVPAALPKLLGDPDPAKAQTAMAAMMRMKKIVIRNLSKMPKPHKPITIKTTVNAPIEKAWKSWTTPADIMAWNHANDDWHCPNAENDLRAGGQFSSTMAAKDGSFSFDFGGTHTEVIENQRIASVLEDGRKMSVTFKAVGKKTLVTEVFDPENMNPIELQKAGWQAILDNFKKHADGK